MQSTPNEQHDAMYPAQRLVLVVDDDPVIRRQMTISLERSGFLASIAADGLDAIAQIRAVRPDLVLLDTVMPEMGGLDVLRYLRSEAEFDSLPIIVVSALDRLDDRLAAFDAGADDFLVKPFGLQELLARVSARFRDRGALRAAMQRSTPTETPVPVPDPVAAAGLSDAEWVARTIDDLDFAVVFQPIVCLDTASVVAFEALARFPGGVSPEEGFARAWRCDRGAALELALLDEAIRQAHALPLGVALHLNVSALAAAAPELSLVVAAARRPVVIEVTEHDLMNIAHVDLLRRMVPPTVSIAVDDVGAGYSGLSLLVGLRPQLIKIDRSLVIGVGEDEARQAIVRGLVQFALAVNGNVIAEGVETADELRMLHQLGVPFAQGFHFAPGVPITEAAVMTSFLGRASEYRES